MEPAIWTLPAQAQAQAGTEQRFDIPPQPLSQALVLFATQSGYQVATDGATLQGIRSSGVNGTMPAAEALSRVLGGTGFAFRISDNVVRLETLPKRSEGTIQLGPVRVAGEGGDRHLRTSGPEIADGPVNGYLARRSATGSKTDTPLIETPQTINIVTADQMQAQGAQSVEEALRYTPGAVANVYGGTTYSDFINLRGFEAPKYVDGLRQPSGLRGYAQTRLEPYGLERVELLKGPASVLYGQSTPGGLLNQVRKRPTAEPFREAQLQGGSFGRIQGAFDLSGPFVEGGDLRYRLTGLWRDAHTQADSTRDDRVFIAPALSFEPSDRTSFTVLGHFQRDVSAYASYPAIGTLLPNVNGRISRKTFLGRDDFDKYEREQYMAGYLFEHRFDDVLTVRQKLQYTEIHMDFRYSYLNQFQNNPAVPATYQRSMRRALWNSDDKTSAFTVDTHLQARFEGGGIEHTLLAGVDYSRFRFNSLFGSTIEGFIDIYDDEAIPRGADPALFPDQDHKRRQVGLYGQYQLKAGGLVVMLGGRQDWAEGWTHNSNNGLVTPLDDSDFTWRAGAVYVFDNGIAPYASYSTSFEPVEGSDAAGVPFKPTEGEQFEAGVRWQPADENISIGIAAFHLTQKNVLTQDSSPPASTPWAQIQTGEIRVKGIEVEAKASLTAGLDVVASYSLSESDITKSNTAAQLGNALQRTPKNQASLWGDYTVQSGPLAGLGIGGGVRYFGGSWGDLNNTIRLPSYILVDATIHYDLGTASPSLEGLTLRVNASNLFDKRYVSSCFSLNSGNCYYGNARQVLATLAWRW